MKQLVVSAFLTLISCSSLHQSNDNKNLVSCNKSDYLTKEDLINKAKFIAWSGGARYLVDPRECTPVGFCDYVGPYPIPKGTKAEIIDQCVVLEGGIQKPAGKGDCVHASVSFPAVEIVAMAKAKKNFPDMYSSEKAYSELIAGGYNGYTPAYSFLMDRCGNFLGD